MKLIIASLVALSSLSAFSQIQGPLFPDFSGVDEAMARLVKAHTESSGVQEVKADVEQKYAAKCEGSSSSFSPDISKRVKYTATCKGENEFKLTIKSKFKSSKSGVEFSLMSYELKF